MRIGRRLKSDAEDAALDLRERHEDLLDNGTGDDDAEDGMLASPPVKMALWSLGSKKGAVSSLQSENDGVLGGR